MDSIQVFATNIDKKEVLMFKPNKRSLPSVQVESIEDAARKWEQYRYAMVIAGNGGVSQIGNGGTVYSTQGVLARISYNGRIAA